MKEYITITRSQAKNLVNKWNDLANDRNQLTIDQAHLIMANPSFDEELIKDGVTSVELRGLKTVTGNPATFTVWLDDVCLTMDDTTLGWVAL